MRCELSGREWVKFIWHLISLHGCWLSDRVSNAGRQRPGMTVAAGVCPEQHSSIQYSRSCSMLLRASRWISKPPTDAPYKLIFFQPINIIQMSCPNIFIKAEIRDKVWSPSLHTPLSLRKVTACYPLSFSLANTEWFKNMSYRPKRDKRHLFSCWLGVAKNCRGPIVLLNDGRVSR